MKYVSVKQVASYIKDQFKIEMEIYDVIRNSAEALKLLKMYAIGQEITFAMVEDFQIKLDGVYDVRAAIRLTDTTWLDRNITIQDIAFPPQIVFDMPTTPVSTETVTFKDNYISHLRGPYIDFVFNCPCVEFNEDKVWVALDCRSIKKDEEGYPMIPELCFYACAYYCMYAYHLPLFLLEKISPFVWAEIKDMKDRKFGQARGDKNLMGLNQNEVDKLFNVMYSMDRKTYNFHV